MRARRAPSFGGRKPSKKKRSVGRPATASAASAADGPGAASMAWPASQAARTSLKPGIGNQRRAGVGHQRDRLAGGEPRQQLRPRRGGVVLVVGRQRRGDAVMVEQPAGHAGVLAGDQVGGGQRLQRPQRDVAQVADRGGDQVQTGGQPRRLDRLAGEDIGAGEPADSADLAGGFIVAHGRHCNRRPGRRHGCPDTAKTQENQGLYPFHLVNLWSSLCRACHRGLRDRSHSPF